MILADAGWEVTVPLAIFAVILLSINLLRPYLRQRKGQIIAITRKLGTMAISYTAVALVWWFACCWYAYPYDAAQNVVAYAEMNDQRWAELFWRADKDQEKAHNWTAEQLAGIASYTDKYGAFFLKTKTCIAIMDASGKRFAVFRDKNAKYEEVSTEKLPVHPYSDPPPMRWILDTIEKRISSEDFEIFNKGRKIQVPHGLLRQSIKELFTGRKFAVDTKILLSQYELNPDPESHLEDDGEFYLSNRYIVNIAADDDVNGYSFQVWGSHNFLLELLFSNNIASQMYYGFLGLLLLLIPTLLTHLAVEYFGRRRELQDTKNFAERSKGFSHALKTPLQIVKSQAEGILLAQDLGQAQDRAKVIQTNAEKAQTLVYGLLDHLSREDASKPPMKPFPLDILLLDLYEDDREWAGSKEIDMQPPEMPNDKVEVVANRTDIEIAVKNFFENAVEYTPPRNRIKIRLVKKKRKWVRVAVENTGVHIPRNELRKIWRITHRVGNAASDDHYGLGLHDVKRIIQRHKGRYGCRNTVDGVEFWFEISTR